MGAGGKSPIRLTDVAQALLAHGVFLAVRLMPFAMASAIGGFLGRHLGPLLGVTKVARRNVALAFPEKRPSEIESVIRGMWDNLGRSIFEFPLLGRVQFDGPNARGEIVGVEYMDALQNDNAPGIFVSGHLANWEVPARGVESRGITLHLIYRAPNNPLMESLFAQRRPGRGELLPKGSKGARRAIQLLNAGEHLGVLVDQKMNDGIAVPFFTRDAMTAPAVAQFAYRYGCPIVPVRVERVRKTQFRVTAYPPLTLPDTGDKQANILRLMTEINALLEGWIRERPEQWLWVHRRWPD